MLRTWVRRAALLAALTAGLLLTAGPSYAATAPRHQVGAVVVTHRVVSGDTSWGLAARYCGTGQRYVSMTVRSPGGTFRDLARIWPDDIATIPCARYGHTPDQPATKPVAKLTAASGWTHPLPGSRCVSGWGAPRDGGARAHKGIDLPARSGTPIRAAHAGRVTLVRWSVNNRGKGAGWYLMLSHGVGRHTVYMHMRSRSFLAVGASVRAGQVVGYVGASGASSPHLHFEVHRAAWVRVNPAPFLRSVGVRVVGCS